MARYSIVAVGKGIHKPIFCIATNKFRKGEMVLLNEHETLVCDTLKEAIRSKQTILQNDREFRNIQRYIGIQIDKQNRKRGK